MPSSPVSPARDAASSRGSQVRVLTEQIPRFLRLGHAVRGSAAAQGNDRAALVLLYPLMRLGPLRQGVLADLVHADPSTVSRHVAVLVERGLVARVADGSDGRPSRLVVTDAGRAAFDDLRAEPESQLERATASWSDEDLASLTALFGRLLDDLTAVVAGLPGTSSDPALRPTAPRENR